MYDKNKFDYNDINLIPNKGIVNSRSECNVETTLGKHTFKLPVIPANMSSIINEDLAILLSQNNYFYILHRFGIDNIAFVKKCKELNIISSISIGVNQQHYDEIIKLMELNLIPDYITIDIAHGHSILMEKMLRFLKHEVKIDSFIIAGNICTEQAVLDLQLWEADAIKAGIAGGFSCSTYMESGFGNRHYQAQMINDVSKVATVPIIADGSITEHGHIAKALVLGAHMIMAGNLFSGHTESPGNIVEVDGHLYMEYFGSASEHQTGKNSRIEGVKKLVPYKNKSILIELKSIEEALQSSISYSGGTNIEHLKFLTKWK